MAARQAAACSWHRPEPSLLAKRARAERHPPRRGPQRSTRRAWRAAAPGGRGPGRRRASSAQPRCSAQANAAVCACEDGQPKLPQLPSAPQRSAGRGCATRRLSALPAAALPTKPLSAAQARASRCWYATCAGRLSALEPDTHRPQALLSPFCCAHAAWTRQGGRFRPV